MCDGFPGYDLNSNCILPPIYVFDYNTSEGMKLYKSVTEKLHHTFDGETGSLRLFLQALQQRADALG